MKSLKCSDLSGMDCDFEATGETAEDVKNAILAHGMERHAEMLASLSAEEQNTLM